MGSVKFIKRDIEDLISRRVEKMPNGCWEWRGHVMPNGYGVIYISHSPLRRTTAHRFFYSRLVEKVLPKFHVDHLCRNRMCVNPQHLRQVSVKVNVLTGIGLSAENSRKTHCKKGHPLSGDNLRITQGKYGPQRICLVCSRKYERERHRKMYGWKPRIKD